MLPDDPTALIAGKDYGSEGTAQRYLCALLISGPGYGYHKSWPLSERGARFVSQLYSRSFGSPQAGAPQFWNEMNLLAVDADDKHAVDYAFLWPRVHFLVELKTLGGSHRPGQLAEYLLRARHHNPEPTIDLLYLTHPMAAASPDHLPERAAATHTSAGRTRLRLRMLFGVALTIPRRFAASGCYESTWRRRELWPRSRFARGRCAHAERRLLRTYPNSGKPSSIRRC